MGTMTKREIISQKKEENGGQQPSMWFKSLLPKEFGSRRPQLKDAADQTFSLIKWGRSRWQVKFTEYIRSSNERKNTSELQVPCPQNPSTAGRSVVSHCVWFWPLHWSQRARDLRPRVYNGGASVAREHVAVKSVPPIEVHCQGTSQKWRGGKIVLWESQNCWEYSKNSVQQQDVFMDIPQQIWRLSKGLKLPEQEGVRLCTETPKDSDHSDSFLMQPRTSQAPSKALPAKSYERWFLQGGTSDTSPFRCECNLEQPVTNLPQINRL